MLGSSLEHNMARSATEAETVFVFNAEIDEDDGDT